MTTANKQVKARIEAYILNAIDGSGYDRQPETDQQKLIFLATTFKTEYCYKANFQRYKTVQAVLREWIMGLPSCFNIAFYNGDILETAKTFGNLPETMTEAQEDKIISQWFDFLAVKTLQLMNKHGIENSFFTQNLKD
jgi:hypothetical protein